MKDLTFRREISRRSAWQMTAAGAGSVLAGGLTACSPKSAGGATVDDAVAWAKANLPNSTPEIVQAAAKEGHLTLTMLNQGGNTELLTSLISGFNKRYPFITVESTAQSTVQLVNKINAELAARRGTSDYINFPGNLHTTATLEKQGAIQPFVISQDAAFPAGAKHNGIWYAWRTEYPSTAYRKGVLTEEERKLVQTFEGLGDPRFKNRIGIGNVENSSTAAGAYILQDKTDPKVWQALVANKPRVKTTATSLINGLLSGEYDITVLSGMVPNVQAARDGAPIELGVSSPFPTVYTPSGISALAPHPNAAKLWQDWVMSSEGQNLFVKYSGFASARNDLVEKPWAEQQPWFFKDMSKRMDMDWDDFAVKQADVSARFKKDLQGG